MDVFGEHWRDHPAKIAAACRAVVAPDDLLLMPGDLSWALKRANAEPDLAWLAALPGIKVLSKGNHDYWWDSDKPLDYPGLHDTPFVSDDGQVGVAGTRGWYAPDGEMTAAEQAQCRKVIAREVQRLDRRLDGHPGLPAQVRADPLPAAGRVPADPEGAWGGDGAVRTPAPERQGDAPAGAVARPARAVRRLRPPALPAPPGGDVYEHAGRGRQRRQERAATSAPPLHGLCRGECPQRGCPSSSPVPLLPGDFQRVAVQTLVAVARGGSQAGDPVGEAGGDDELDAVAAVLVEGVELQPGEPSMGP